MRRFDRRQVLEATGLSVAGAAWSGSAQAEAAGRVFELASPHGWLSVEPLADNAVRVRFSATRTPPSRSYMLQPQSRPFHFERSQDDREITLRLPRLVCRVERAGGVISFHDAQGRELLAETDRRLTSSPVAGAPAFAIQQGFRAAKDERLFGCGQFQDGFLDLKGLSRRLTQVNTQVSLPFFLSSKGYGLLWHNNGLTELNPLDQAVVLSKQSEDATAKAVDVTTTTGGQKVLRRGAVFEGRMNIAHAGDYALLLDIGRSMASQYFVQIDEKVLVDFSNYWLPPTTSLFAHLDAGEHRVRVVCRADDAPTLRFGPVTGETVLRSPVAEAIDYVVISGDTGAEIISGYRQLTGAAPMFPKWAFGYIHCRERFKSQQELLAVAREFRERKIQVDVVVQDWQYWGKYGWNAMRFDETYYPDPKQMIADLHAIDIRFMLSVWAKVDRNSDLGKALGRKGFYIPNTDWVDFFKPEASDFYWEAQRQGLLSLGVDAFWQDATEPENDDLHGRTTAAGPGDTVRLMFPMQVSRTVYEGQRRDRPRQRVFTLTRCAAPGQQRYATAVWSGDVGNDWETLKRQICAGLNFVAAGMPYWTVDAGGFFRPEGQYADPAYHERLIRWFQYATFLPLQRIHGYQTDTEFWRYGEEVERCARACLDLRYRLLPYIYSEAGDVTQKGSSLMRPLVLDFVHDARALDQKHSYMFGRALHVAPVVEPNVSRWPVYLPDAPGGWFDFWTGEHRPGGAEHLVEAPLGRIPLHVRAGALIPLGPAVQSTASATGEDLELRVYPGADGEFSLYEDDGLSYDYERGAFTRIRFNWRDRDRVLTLGPREGSYPGMLGRRRFRVVSSLLDASSTKAADIVYDGTPLTVRI